MGRSLGRLSGCTCDAWAPDEDCPHHGERRSLVRGTCCWALVPGEAKPCEPALCSRTEPPPP